VPDALDKYRKKRDAGATAEPFGSVAASPSTGGNGGNGGNGGIFVVQLHAATRLHYDLRLEMDGILRSWAGPRRPSRAPAGKRPRGKTSG